MKRYLLIYIITFLSMLPLDFLFIGILAKGFFQSQVGPLLGELNISAAVVFYVMYVAGIIIFASGTASSWQNALLYGLLFGFFCYGTFEFTCMALLKDWTWKMVAVDLAWGTFVTGFAASVGYLLGNAADRAIG